MTDFLVVGSGATGVHFARTVLDQGHRVTMIDVGHEKPPAPASDATFQQLKDRLDDPETYFLGPRGESVVFPAPTAKPYGFPESKAYVFRRPASFEVEDRGFQPMLSFARGGLAEAWTGGSYELTDAELAWLGFPSTAMRAAYAAVATRIGVGAIADDLQRFSPVTAPYLEPLPLDPHSGALVDRYLRRRDAVNALGAWVGRSRVAVLSRALGDRKACGNLGRCLWGCPNDALYAPSHTLRELRSHPAFSYVPARLVTRVDTDGAGRAIGVVSTDLHGHGEERHRGDRVILAAGALASTRIYLETLAARGGNEPCVEGLMDNGHVMIPFVNPRRLGADVKLDDYQFHMLAMGIEADDWRHHAHAQVTTLKAASVHPIVNNLPFDLRSSLRVFQRIRGALGVANLWLSDNRRASNVARLQRDREGRTRLVLEYARTADDVARTERMVQQTRRVLGALGCIAPGFMVKVLPRGSSVHYAGTLPLAETGAAHTTAGNGEVHGIPGLHVVDGSTFRWLPAKNITFSLMANATRIARELS